MRRTLWIWAALGAVLAAPAAPAMELELHGFVQGAASLRASSHRLAAPSALAGKRYNWLAAEERLRLEATGDSDDGSVGFVAKVDALYDNALVQAPGQAANPASLDVRELWGEWRGDLFEVRAGRQMMTWGVADRLFISDIWPKNWAAFYAGLPLEYMKLPVDALKITHFAGPVDIELVLAPRAQVDVVPDVNRWVVYMPPGMRGEKKPAGTLHAGEAGLRVHIPAGSWDFNLYAARTHWHQPDKAMDAQGFVIYPRLNVYAGTIQGGVLGGVLSLEAGLYQSVEDKNGTNPYIANSQQRWLVGYEHEIWPDATLALQVYGERMLHYQAYLRAAQQAFAAGQGPKPLPRHRIFYTANLRAQFLNQTLVFALFAMHIQHGGTMVNPELSYAVNDALSVAAGGHVFKGGPDSWLLGMMKHDDNAYLWARWSF